MLQATGTYNPKFAKVSGKEYRSGSIHIPSKLLNDSKFPFTRNQKQKVEITIDEENNRLIIAPISGCEHDNAEKTGKNDNDRRK